MRRLVMVLFHILNTIFRCVYIDNNKLSEYFLHGIVLTLFAIILTSMIIILKGGEGNGANLPVYH